MQHTLDEQHQKLGSLLEMSHDTTMAFAPYVLAIG
jgi:hypothetical protein